MIGQNARRESDIENIDIDLSVRSEQAQDTE